MAGETLKTSAELLADFPESTAGLIEAINSRNFVIGATPGIGALEDDPLQTPFTIPLVAGVPVDVPAQLVLPLFVGNYWALDGNAAMVPSYDAAGIFVPPAHARLVQGLITLRAAKTTGGSETYLFAGTQGVGTGDEFAVELTNNPSTFTMSAARIYDVSLGAPVSFTVESVGGASIDIYHVRFSLESLLI